MHASTMANSKHPDEEPSGTTSRLPKALRRSKSRLPLSSVASSQSISGSTSILVDSATARSKNPSLSLREAPKSKSFSARTASVHLSDSTHSKYIPRPRRAGHPAGDLSVSTTTTDSHMQYPRRRPPPASSQTPSLVSGSSLSTSDVPQSPLRRKTFNVDGNATRVRADTDGFSDDREASPSTQKASDNDPFPGAILGISLPPTNSHTLRGQYEEGSIGNVRRTPGSTFVDECLIQALQCPPTSLESSAASSSRCSESHFSLLSTPTSASSYSPSMTQRTTWDDHPRSGKLTVKRHPSTHQPAVLPRDAAHDASRTAAAAPYKPAVRLVGRVKQEPEHQRGVLDESIQHRLPTSPSSTPARRGAARRGVARKELGESHAERPVQVPPELAHLNVDCAAAKPSTSRSTPRRPSRDGTADLMDHQGLTSVVQSDLPALYTTFSKRNPSVESPTSGGSRGLFGFSSRNSSHQGSPRLGSTMSPSVSTRLSSEIEDDADVRRQDSPMAAKPPSPVASRFGFLPKRQKDSSPVLDKSERSRRRGPAAGTGHEGYGRLGLRSRSSSLQGIFESFIRSPSADSTGSTKTKRLFGRKGNTESDDEGDSNDLGDHLKGKTSPATLRGKKKSAPLLNTRKVSESFDRPDASHSYSVQIRGNSWPTPTIPSHAKFDNTSHTTSNVVTARTHDEVDESNQLANPRTMRTNSATTEFLASHVREGREGHWLRTSPKQISDQTPSSSPSFAERLHAKTVSRQKEHKDIIEEGSLDVSHYAFAGGDHSVSIEDIKKLVDLKASVSPRQAVKKQIREPVAQCVPFERRHQGLMPSPPLLTRTSAKQSNTDSPEGGARETSTGSPKLLKAQTATSARSPQLVDISRSPSTTRPNESSKPRLSPVGRIPPVASSVDKGRKLPNQLLTQPLLSVVSGGVKDSARMQYHEKGGSQPLLSETGSKKLQGDNVHAMTQSNIGSKMPSFETFLAFPSRDSELSYTSSSSKDSPDDLDDRMNKAYDDRWSEYNDLCEENMPSLSRGNEDGKAQPKTPLRRSPHVRSSRQDVAIGMLQGSTETMNSQSATTPITPFSISDYLTEGDRTSKSSNLAQRSAPNLGSETKPVSRRLQSLAVPVAILTSQTEKKSLESLSSQVQSRQVSDVSMATTSTQAGAVHTTGEFRHAALVTSKWLSFGRVLFSPIHNEAKVGKDARILILDGLGREWAYYCALSYPNCQFYHLGPGSSAATNESVPNYRHVPHASLSAAFPFPRGFFTGIIMRFPKVTSDIGYQACTSEIKRTLRPGGYLEMSTVDLDLVNMGSKARKAIKDLKVRIHQADDQLSLWNQGDAFLKLLGSRGFDGIQRCVVALPAAGRVALSQDSSDSQSAYSPQMERSRAVEAEVEGPGLADLLRNRSDDGQLDEQITKTVARVGRWWYSTCYEETIAGSDGSGANSLWTTPGLIREMERKGTSLRLMICYAQKPVSTKRRTASV
ncbi:hypothetical protein BDV97DRAFT_116627 [Delphinella strobiligena]|nr:hypothetical protein BDV97DRAFT_116627 [Delphinella strobiligena]